MTPWTVASQAPLSVGLPQAQILEWVAISFSIGSSWPRDRTHVSYNVRWILYHWATWGAPGKGKALKSRSINSRSAFSHQPQVSGSLAHNSASSVNRPRKCSQAQLTGISITFPWMQLRNALPYKLRNREPQTMAPVEGGNSWEQTGGLLTVDKKNKPLVSSGWNQTTAGSRKPVLYPEIRTWHHNMKVERKQENHML